MEEQDLKSCFTRFKSRTEVLSEALPSYRFHHPGKYLFNFKRTIEWVMEEQDLKSCFTRFKSRTEVLSEALPSYRFHHPGMTLSIYFILTERC